MYAFSMRVPPCPSPAGRGRERERPASRAGNRRRHDAPDEHPMMGFGRSKRKPSAEAGLLPQRSAPQPLARGQEASLAFGTVGDAGGWRQGGNRRSPPPGPARISENRRSWDRPGQVRDTPLLPLAMGLSRFPRVYEGSPARDPTHAHARPFCAAGRASAGWRPRRPSPPPRRPAGARARAYVGASRGGTSARGDPSRSNPRAKPGIGRHGTCPGRVPAPETPGAPATRTFGTKRPRENRQASLPAGRRVPVGPRRP